MYKILCIEQTQDKINQGHSQKNFMEAHMTALLEVTTLLESFTVLLEYLDLLQFSFQSVNDFY